MTSTVENARDEVLTLAKNAFGEAVGGMPAHWKLFWDDMKAPDDTQKFAWARVSMRHTDGGQSAISGGLGKGRYSRKGTLYVNLFAVPGDGLRVLDPIVKKVLDAYEGKATPSQVWFRKGRVRELGVVDGWFQINVLFDFTYDEIK